MVHRRRENKAQNVDISNVRQYNIYKGKPVEKQGRKAKGLRSQLNDYDSRLPH